METNSEKREGSEIKPGLLDLIADFQNKLTDLYDHNAFNSPFDHQAIDEGVQMLNEAWQGVKGCMEVWAKASKEYDKGVHNGN